MSDRKSTLQPLALALTAAAALLRLAPHSPNFTPIGGIALFGGARLKGWQAYVVPLLAMLATDPILSHMAGYPAYWRATPIIYFSMLIYVVLGRFIVGQSTSPWRIGAAAILGSMQFFVVTNLFEWWAGMSMYPHTLAGLVMCYTAALPFFSRTLAADFVYSGVLFAAYSLVSKKLESTTRNHATL